MSLQVRATSLSVAPDPNHHWPDAFMLRASTLMVALVMVLGSSQYTQPSVESVVRLPAVRYQPGRELRGPISPVESGS